MNQTEGNPGGVSPQWALLIQATDVLRAIDAFDWDSLEAAQKRGFGLAARWAMERAFSATFYALGRPVPQDMSLVRLCAASGLPFLPEQRARLENIDKYVHAEEFEEDWIDGEYREAVQLAIGVVSTIQQNLIGHGIVARRPDVVTPESPEQASDSV